MAGWVFLPALAAGQTPAERVEQRKAAPIRVSVNLVVLNASVSGAQGKPLSDLLISDFEVREDGEVQPLVYFSSGRDETSFQVALLVDTSGSTQTKIALLRGAAGRFLRKLRPQDRVAIIDIGDEPGIIQDFTSDRVVLSKSIRKLGRKPSESTALYDGVLTALTRLFKGQDPKAIVLLSDGVDNGSRIRSESVRQAVFQSDAVLYGLLVNTEPAVRARLEKMAHNYSRIAIVLDARSSEGVSAVKACADQLLDRLPPSAEVGLVIQRTVRRAALVQPFTREREAMRQAIEKADPIPTSHGGTSSWKASTATILITDSGRDIRNRVHDDIVDSASMIPLDVLAGAALEEALNQVQCRVPDVVSVRRQLDKLSEGYETSREFIREICAHSGGQEFDLTRLEELDDFYERVAEALRNTYTLGYYSGAEAGPRFHTLEVRVPQREGSSVRTRRGFVLSTVNPQ
jgi:Mg-chelatase subunit ChlD